MKFTTITAALCAAALAVPAAAQETRQPSKGEQILGNILRSVLAPPEQPKTADTATTPVAEVAPVAMMDMTTVLADPRRDGDRARDGQRHPAETLQFFGVKPGMSVVDYMPAGGWYTRVLVPYLGANGRYLGVTPDAAAADGERFANYFKGLPDGFRKETGEWSLTGAPYAVVSSDQLSDATKGTVDRVLVFREMHNLMRSGVMYTELTRLRDLLKADGMLGIVQHRAKADAPADYTLGGNGYLRQKDVIALVEAHGFQLVSTSEINANPKDTADHDGGVWTRAPSFRGAEEGSDERAARAALGESDRMTLLFRKR